MQSLLPRRVALCAALLLTLFVTIALAAPGDLDTSFNGTGKVTTPIGSSDDFAQGVAIQPDGKIVTAGFTEINSNLDFAIVRYNTDGTLDTSFNGTGIVTTAVGSTFDEAYAVAIQPDGKIVAAGYSDNGSTNNFAVVRYNPNGSLDTTFNGTGKVVTPIGSNNDIAYAVAIQPDGKIVAAGLTFTSNIDIAVVRYNANGTLDTSFNSTGIVITPIGSSTDQAQGVAIQPDGKIVAAGLTYNGSDYDIAIVRYNANGTLDTTFNGTGKVITGIGSSYEQANAVALQPDGQIVAAGYSFNGSNNDIALVRYNSNGTLDTSFNSTGIVITPIGSSTDQAQGVAIQPDGKIVAAGLTYNGSNNDFAIVRYNANGILDTSLNETGKITTPIGSSDDLAYAVAIQPNGKIVAAGYIDNGSNYDIALARYQAFTAPNRIANFDADTRTDISVWNPTNHNWYILNSSTNQIRIQLDWGNGSLGDVVVPGDYDGDGKTDLAVWRPSEGNWYIIKSSDSTVMLQNWGGSGDIPVPGDYDGDGKTDVAVYRPNEGNWYIKNSRNNTVTVKGWGGSSDKPVEADYDGDGRTDIAVFRPAEGNWYIITSHDGFTRLINWGASSDKLVEADYDGDGRVDVAVYRPAEGNWYIKLWAGTTIVRGWGNNTDTPVPADYDGDGKADIAVFRPSEGNWYIINSSTNSISMHYLGGSGDVPVVSAYLPQ